MKASKKTYSKPTLMKYGKVVEMTQSGTYGNTADSGGKYLRSN